MREAGEFFLTLRAFDAEFRKAKAVEVAGIRFEERGRSIRDVGKTRIVASLEVLIQRVLDGVDHRIHQHVAPQGHIETRVEARKLKVPVRVERYCFDVPSERTDVGRFDVFRA